MAETGWLTPFDLEALEVALAGHGSAELFYGDFLYSPGSTSSEFVATPTFSQVTWVTMIAPSPDWFAGVNGLQLFDGTEWVDGLVVDLIPYDAGTDSGISFTSQNAPTVPPVPISAITRAPLATGGYAPPIGTLTFEILEIAESPPSGDPDGDGRGDA
jgi:hypothetical protein